jgi:MoxR-like ATPase
MDAVNCAIAPERPLLLKGEPGTGKTVLARHVADGLGMPMLSWHIKSTSKAPTGSTSTTRAAAERQRRFGTTGDVSTSAATSSSVHSARRSPRVRVTCC